MVHECVQKERITRLEDKTLKDCEFKGSVEADMATVKGSLKDLHSKVNTLLFTVLASVFIAVITLFASRVYGNAQAQEINNANMAVRNVIRNENRLRGTL